MDATSEAPGGDGADAEPEPTHGDAAPSGVLESATSTTLVEVSSGVALLFGEVPDGVELIDPDFIPAFDRTELNTALGALGNIGTAVGNVAETVGSARGLYRVSAATRQLLTSGGQLAVKDGAHLGGILKGGNIVAQARFIPASVTAAAATAAIGPAAAMLALQLQLGEISRLVQDNIALTGEVLKEIRREQRASLQGLADTVDRALREASELGTVNDSVWDLVADKAADISKYMRLYREQVAEHVKILAGQVGHDRRRYLETNARDVVFDTYALATALKLFGSHEALRAARARIRGAHDRSEIQASENIRKGASQKIAGSLTEIRKLVSALVRGLSTIAHTPGEQTVPGTKKHKDAQFSKATCQELLKHIKPLAEQLGLSFEMPEPECVCVPEGLDLEPYLSLLRWSLHEGEGVRVVAFVYDAGERKDTELAHPRLAKWVDQSWEGLSATGLGRLFKRPSTLVAVTDARLVTVNAESFLKSGQVETEHSLNDVALVRRPAVRKDAVRPTIDVITGRDTLRWMVPDAADPDSIDRLVSVIDEGSSGADAPAAITSSGEAPP